MKQNSSLGCRIDISSILCNRCLFRTMAKITLKCYSDNFVKKRNNALSTLGKINGPEFPDIAENFQFLKLAFDLYLCTLD